MEGREEEGVENGKAESGPLDALVQTGDRIASALEKLAADPEVEIEAGPPLCPACGKFDPEIILPEQESARGPMSQLVVEGTCGECGHKVFIIIESYSVHQSRMTAVNEIKEREKGGFFDVAVR